MSSNQKKSGTVELTLSLIEQLSKKVEGLDRNSGIIELKISNIEGGQSDLKRRIQKNADGVYEIRLDISSQTSDIAILKKIVFPAVGLILAGVLSTSGAALLWFLSNS